MPKGKREPNIPQQVIDSLARCILPEIQRYFESDKGKEEFARWKEKKKQKGV